MKQIKETVRLSTRQCSWLFDSFQRRSRPLFHKRCADAQSWMPRALVRHELACQSRSRSDEIRRCALKKSLSHVVKLVALHDGVEMTLDDVAINPVDIGSTTIRSDLT